MIPLGKQLNLTYTSALEKMVSVNSSFDAGVLRVCYHGKNRNRSEIGKEVFEKCIDTIYNCPIVCNYIREDDEIGSHDVEVVKTNNGLKLVNVTTPVGVVPTGANYWWEEVEDNGVTHEYLCVEVLIWKRQEAYTKLKENGITDESMEITVKDGEMIDGYYRVYDFEFTAFCLLGTAEPCFESASVRLFEKDEFSSMYSAMMADLKHEISEAQPANAVDILHPKNHSEGGNEDLDKKMELMTSFGLVIEELDFNLEDFELEVLEEKFEEIKRRKDDDDDDDDAADNNGDGGNPEDNTDNPDNGGADDSDPDIENPEDGSEGNDPETFSLTGEQFRNELIEALSEVKMMSSWGEEIPKYIYVDYDTDASEVYCYDWEDWKLYGFHYTLSGDAVKIDFADKKRKKFSIVDFEEGDSNLAYTHIYETISGVNASEFKAQHDNEVAQLQSKYSEAEKEISTLNAEIASLRQYKDGKLKDERDEAEKELFSAFEDLNGIEAFKTLKENAKDFSLEDLEDKCFALRGRKNSTMNFSSTNRTPKLPVHRHENIENEPYGGLFIKYKKQN